LFGKVATGAFDASGAMEAVSLGMSISLAFAALRNGSLWSWWFKFNFGMLEGLYVVDIFVAGARFEIHIE
jgi:hypothetical protein